MTYIAEQQSLAIIEFAEDNTFHLPAELVKDLEPGERFVVFRSGDTILLKRIYMGRITDVVAAAPESEPALTLDEINEIVHTVRQQDNE